MDKKIRLGTLKKKKKLTNAEFKELVQLSDPGSFKKSQFRIQHLGVSDLEKFFKNWRMMPRKAKRAYKNQCYLEVLSLRLLNIDLYLRTFIQGMANQKLRVIIQMKPGIQFGKLIEVCQKAGMERKLVDEIRNFNSQRTKGIHRLIMGEIEYKDLKSICDRTSTLSEKVRDYVLPRTYNVPMN